MKYLTKSILLIAIIAIVSCAGTKTSEKAKSPAPDGYQGVYVNDLWEGDNSIFPVNLTGLVFHRNGDSYDIMLSNINDGEAEEIEQLDFVYKDGKFIIEFSSISEMILEKDKTGLSGTLSLKDKVNKIHLKKIK